jgi:hypothetical protein
MTEPVKAIEVIVTTEHLRVERFEDIVRIVDVVTGNSIAFDKSAVPKLVEALRNIIYG